MAHVPIKALFNLSKFHEIKMGFDFSKGYLSNFGLNYQPHMKKFLFVLLLSPLTVLAQPHKKYANADTYKYMFGLGMNFIDDDGNASSIAGNKILHYNPFPSRLMADYYLYNGWSVEGAFAMAKYASDRWVNGQMGVTGNILSIDGNLKYSFYKLLNKGLIDPYLIGGAGLTFRNSTDTLAVGFAPTINVGGGVNIWVNNAIGIQLQSCGKIALTSDFFGKSDYVQHTIGVVIRLETISASKEGEFKKENLHLDMKRRKIKQPKDRDKDKQGDA